MQTVTDVREYKPLQGSPQDSSRLGPKPLREEQCNAGLATSRKPEFCLVVIQQCLQKGMRAEWVSGQFGAWSKFHFFCLLESADIAGMELAINKSSGPWYILSKALLSTVPAK